MSTTTATTVLSLGIGALVGGVYALREYYIPIRTRVTRDKQRIQELEEEIVRLKREMRICGIRLGDGEDSKITPGK